jgi:hypothetical protein
MRHASQSAILAASLLGTIAKAAESMGRPDIAAECRKDIERLPSPDVERKREVLITRKEA